MARSLDVLNDVLNQMQTFYVIYICDSFSWSELSVRLAYRCYGNLRTRQFLTSAHGHNVIQVYPAAAGNSGSFLTQPFCRLLVMHYSWFHNRGLDFCIQHSLYVFIWFSFHLSPPSCIFATNVCSGSSFE